MGRWGKRIWEVPLVVAAALVFLFEDFLWAWLDAALGRLARLPLWARLERRVARLPPYAAMALFLVPVVVLFPAHLLAVYLAATGRVGLAALVYVAVKIVGTAMLARLFTLCRPALMRLRWFARLYRWVVATKAALYARLEAIPAWRRTRAAMRAAVAAMRAASAASWRGRGSAVGRRVQRIRRRWRGV